MTMMHWWNNGGDGYGGWWGSGPWDTTGGWSNNGLEMLLMMLIIWLPLIGLAIWLVRRMTRPDSGHATTPTTQAPSAPRSGGVRAILDRRFVEGELSAEQYLEMRRTLEQ